MKLFTKRTSPELCGVISVILKAPADPEDMQAINGLQVWIGESHRSPVALFAHVCLIFEDCTLVLGQEVVAENLRTRLRRQMKLVLEDVHVALRNRILSAPGDIGSLFSIGDCRVPDVRPPVSFQYQSTLYLDGETYSACRTRPMGQSWPDHPEPAYQHSTVFALLDHLCTRSMHRYSAGSSELVRILFGLELLHGLLDSNGAFSETATLNSKTHGVIPNASIKATREATEKELAEYLSELGPDATQSV